MELDPQHSRGGKEEVGQVKEPGSVLDVKDGWIQEAIELLIEIRVFPEGGTRENTGGELVKGTEPPR